MSLYDDVKEIIRRDVSSFEDEFLATFQREREVEKKAGRSTLPNRLKNISADEQKSLLWQILHDWLHFKVCEISALPRLVRRSNCPSLKWYSSKLIDEIEERLRLGRSMSGFSSRRITKKGNLRQRANDKLRLKTGIAHFHLSNLYLNTKQKAGSNNLVFVYVDETDAVLLRVGKHEFEPRLSDFELLQQTAPDIMQKWEIKGVHGVANEISQLGFPELLHAGVNPQIVIKGKTYMLPCGPLSNSGSLVRLVRGLDQAFIAYEEAKSRSHWPSSVHLVWEAGRFCIIDGMRKSSGLRLI